MARAYTNSNEHEAAFGFYKDALKMRQELCTQEPNQPEIARLLSNIGDTCMSLTDYHSAMDYFSQSLSMYKHLAHRHENSSEAQANLLNKIGLVYMAQKNYKSALTFLKESFDLRKISCPWDDRIIAKMLFDLGTAYFHGENFHVALQHFEEAQEIFARISSDPDHADASSSCYDYIGECCEKVTSTFKHYSIAYILGNNLFFDVVEKKSCMSTKRHWTHIR